MNWVFFLKNAGTNKKMTKTKLVWKNVKKRHSETKGSKEVFKEHLAEWPVCWYRAIIALLFVSLVLVFTGLVIFVLT